MEEGCEDIRASLHLEAKGPRVLDRLITTLSPTIHNFKSKGLFSQKVLYVRYLPLREQSCGTPRIACER